MWLTIQITFVLVFANDYNFFASVQVWDVNACLVESFLLLKVNLKHGWPAGRFYIFMGHCSQLCCRDKYSCTHVSRFLGRIWSSLFKVGCRYHFPLSENCKSHIICCLKTLIARYGHFDIWSHQWQSLRDNSIKQLNDTINVKQKNHFWLGPLYPTSSDSNAVLLYLENKI